MPFRPLIINQGRFEQLGAGESLQLDGLTVDNITLDGVSITSDTGAIAFGDEHLTTSGRIGIGALTGAPQRALHIASETALSDDQAYAWRLEHRSTATPVAGFGLNFEYMLHNSINELVEAGIQQVAWTDATDGSEDVVFVWSGAKAGARTSLMTLDASPASTLLTVLGDAKFSTSGSRVVTVERSGGTTLTLNASTTASGAIIWTTTASPLALGSASTVVMTLASGNVYLRADGRRVYFGAGDDASMYFDGASFAVDSGGFLRLDTKGYGTRLFTEIVVSQHPEFRIYGWRTGEASAKYLKTTVGDVAADTASMRVVGTQTGGLDFNCYGQVFTAGNYPGYWSITPLLGSGSRFVLGGTEGGATTRAAMSYYYANTTDSGQLRGRGLVNMLGSDGTGFDWGKTTSTTDFQTEFASGYSRWLSLVDGILTPSDSFHLADNKKLTLGDANDSYIAYNGTNLVIEPNAVGTGWVQVNGGITAEGFIRGGNLNTGHLGFQTTDAFARTIMYTTSATGSSRLDLMNGTYNWGILFHGANDNLEFRYGVGATVDTGTALMTFSTTQIVTIAGTLHFDDDKKITLGTGNDASLYYDGVRNVTMLTGYSPVLCVFNDHYTAGGESQLRFIGDEGGSTHRGAVVNYFDYSNNYLNKRGRGLQTVIGSDGTGFDWGKAVGTKRDFTSDWADYDVWMSLVGGALWVKGGINTGVAGVGNLYNDDTVARFSHSSLAGESGSYALTQTVGGYTNLNAKSGCEVQIKIGNATVEHYTSDAKRWVGKWTYTDASAITLLGRVTTSNATPAAVPLDVNNAVLAIPNHTAWMFKVYLIARNVTTSSTETGAWEITGILLHSNGTVSIVGTPTVTKLNGSQAAWSAAVSADNTNKALTITVTGEATKTIKWVARVEISESRVA